MQINIIFKNNIKLGKDKCYGIMKELSDNKYIIYIDKDQSVIELFKTLIHEFCHVAISICIKNNACNINDEEAVCEKLEKSASNLFKKFIGI